MGEFSKLLLNTAVDENFVCSSLSIAALLLDLSPPELHAVIRIEVKMMRERDFIEVSDVTTASLQ